MLARQLDKLLPQTQCRRCGEPDCASYAAVMARGEAAPNRCPPGGVEVSVSLARLIGVPAPSLDPSCGSAPPSGWVAVIDEAGCIGCTLCLAACPVDAILGARRAMHTVIAAECTACELCIPVCPTDCIGLAPARTPEPWSPAQADHARWRYAFHRARVEMPQAPSATVPRLETPRPELEPASAVAAALVRARARRQRS